MEAGRLFSYKMTHDTGFAPNPFWGYLRLATCKPRIRETKVPGDWVAGFTSDKLCGDALGEERLVFLMQVSEKLPIADYFKDKRFNKKIPSRCTNDHRKIVGDNIYKPLVENPRAHDDFVQVDDYSHGPGEKSYDLSGHYVLIATRFAYFGSQAIPVPPYVRPDVPHGQTAAGQRTHDQARVAKFIEFVRKATSLDSVVASPHDWPAEDGSWQGKREKCAVPRRNPVSVPVKPKGTSSGRC